MTVEQRLRQAVENGEALTITYNGGSKPGTSRLIAPISVTRTRVSAHCYASNSIKTFSIRKIALAGPGGPAPAWLPKPVEPETFSTLSELYEQCKDAWQTLGWHVALAEAMLALYRRSKRGGELLKYPDVTLNYVQFAEKSTERESYTIHYVFNPEQFAKGNAEKQSDVVHGPRQRKRPWVVRANNQANSYGSLSKAAQQFDAHAVAFAPVPRSRAYLFAQADGCGSVALLSYLRGSRRLAQALGIRGKG